MRTPTKIVLALAFLACTAIIFMRPTPPSATVAAEMKLASIFCDLRLDEGAMREWLRAGGNEGELDWRVREGEIKWRKMAEDGMLIPHCAQVLLAVGSVGGFLSR